MPSTVSLRNVVDFTRTRTRMIQLVNVGGVPNQPALDLCNDVLQTLLSAPNNWKFNKAQLPEFTTVPNQQDYWISGCTAKVHRRASEFLDQFDGRFVHNAKAIVSLNSMLSDPPGLVPFEDGVIAHYDRFAPDGIQGKSTNQIPPLFGVGDDVEIQGAGDDAYNGRHTIARVLSKTSFVFDLDKPGLAPDGGQGINSFGWMEHATLEDYFSTAFVKPKRDIIVVAGLYPESIIQPPFKVCMQFERVLECPTHGVSELMIRFWPVPSSQIWRALLFFQRKAELKTSLEDNWAPWPDDLGYVLRSGFYAKALDHGEDPRAPLGDQKWQQDISRALGIRQQEELHPGMFPDLPIQRGG